MSRRQLVISVALVLIAVGFLFGINAAAGAALLFILAAGVAFIIGR